MYSPSLRAHDVFRAAILIGFAWYIASLVKTDSLHYYLAPRMEIWIYWCPVALGFMAVFLLYRAISPEDEANCGCEHPISSSVIKNLLIYGLFLLPLTLGFLLPDRVLGTSAAIKKGFSLSSPLQTELYKENAGGGTSSTQQFMQKKIETSAGLPASTARSSSSSASKTFIAPDAYNEEFASLAGLLYEQPVIQVSPDIFSETIGAIELYKKDFIGKRISLTGFVYKDPQMESTAGSFAIGRFLVLCCTADALPFGVLVHTSEPSNLPNDTWVQIEGMIGTAQVQDQEVLRIDAAEIRKVDQPPIAYVYPNADSVAAFQRANALRTP
ncbi:TIGR03943 family protein [Paenibacillus sp. CAA11]|uniref:TIGR03943 family putative permease subunit n=1 Tax=Paenibacillus sp. CAA11 TaxID=1532905 RepID=UPI000D34AA1A|nr:TIGR03943 family protein [Paenibacillus sp. CAA11]AWB44464.1 TIGR03943 family protein [Paenibacillus sp. CAA11]